MTAILYHQKFLKEFAKLPEGMRKKLLECERIFKLDPFHSLLHTKKLQGRLKDFYSFRVTREYRVIFQFVARQEALWLAVKHRSEIYQK